MHHLLAGKRSSVSDFPLALGKAQSSPLGTPRALTVSKSAATRWQSRDGVIYEESERRRGERRGGGREGKEGEP